MASGTAIHRLLEELAFDGDVAAAWRAGADRLEALVRRSAPPDQHEPALARARELFERIGEGGLLERLAAIGEEHTVARELGIVGPPAGLTAPSGPSAVAARDPAAGFVSGAVDLVYLDGDALVVADYKTDRVEGEAELAEAAEGYRPQGAVYTATVAEALGLSGTPRFELWFLHAGRVVTL